MSEATALPAAYAPFLPVLDLLSQPLAKVLQGQLLQFEPMARGLERREFAMQGEFEGLGGLTHHGTIDHILQSELLLRTEAPLEFLRRLAESESLFHDRIFADPGARHVWRVAVSAGPDMLGHGRLVSLAALFFLARVAARRDCAFHWCFVPRAEGAVWFTGLSINAIKRFLRSAAFREASAQDVAEARASWVEASGERVSGKAPELTDWMIGSGRDWGGDAAAIATQQNALAFTLAPPHHGEPRRAAIEIRRSGHPLHRATIDLAPDRDCLAALDAPFPVPKRGMATAQSGGSVPDMPGWEPQYLSAPSGHYRAVRLADGLLLTKVNVVGRCEGVWFLALPEDVLLVGITILRRTLSVLHHRTQRDEQQLVYHCFQLEAGKDQAALPECIHHETSQHLFRNRMDFALPIIRLQSGILFHSVSGQAYELRFTGRDETHFTSLYKAPRILHSQGSDHVFGQMQQNDFSMQVQKRDNSTALIARAGRLAHPPKRFHGIVWSPQQASLAYSSRVGNWHVLGKDHSRGRLDSADLDFQVEPFERVIGTSMKNSDVHAVVWSDARLGGSGAIETYRYSRGKRFRTSAPIELGEDSARIAALQQVNGLFWAVTCDDQGAPEELLYYNPKTRGGRSESGRYSLARLRTDAARLSFAEEPQ